MDKKEILENLKENIKEYLKLVDSIPQNRYPLTSLDISYDEIFAALHCLLEGRVTMGERTNEFENSFSAYIGSRNAIMVNSGSSANLIVAFALMSELFEGRLFPGDEVVFPALTWPTTIHPFVQAGVRPVFVDIDRATLNIDERNIEQSITPKTRGIVLSHTLGNPCAMESIKSIANKHNLTIIEDTCESLGASIDGKLCGSFGLAGTYSFYFSHHITTIEGGMVVTDDDDFADILRMMRSHGWLRHVKNKQRWVANYSDISHKFYFHETGFNVRPTDMQAAIGLIQLEKLKSNNLQRSRNAEYLCGKLECIDGLTLKLNAKGINQTWFGFPIFIDDTSIKKKLESAFITNHIDFRPVVGGNLLKNPAFEKMEKRIHGKMINTEWVDKAGLYIGIPTKKDDARLDHVVKIIKESHSLV